MGVTSMSLANKVVTRSAKAPLCIGHVRLGAGVGRGQLRQVSAGSRRNATGLVHQENCVAEELIDDEKLREGSSLGVVFSSREDGAT